MSASSHNRPQEQLDHMLDLLADGEPREPDGLEPKTLQQRSKKTIGLATGGAIGSVIPGVGSLLGAIIGYSLADSRWIEAKVDRWIDK